jgi:hypothetical protein
VYKLRFFSLVPITIDWKRFPCYHVHGNQIQTIFVPFSICPYVTSNINVKKVGRVRSWIIEPLFMHE